MAWETFNNFTSSNIVSLRYDSTTSTLEVSFHNGGLYHYYDVPPQIWEALKVASSQGQYLAAHIKGHYRYSKV